MTRAEFTKPRRPSRGPCAAPGCDRDAIIASPLGLCCNRHYQCVRLHGAFTAPTRQRSRDVVCAACGTPFDLGYAVTAGRTKHHYCSRKCRLGHFKLQSINAMPDRFWGHVNKKSPDECWPWTGSLNASGYGQFTWRLGKKRQHLASRVSYFLTNGAIPNGMCVCHSCDNPICVNPAHLWLGTAKDNAQDMARKGRARSNNPQGEAHPCAKIGLNDVLAIRASSMPRAALAQQYGLTAAAIYNIQNRKTWRHV